MFSNEYLTKKHQLIQYLNIYIKKELNMNWVFETIKDRLMKDKPMTENHWVSIIKFIERENQFRFCSREYIQFYFIDFIQTKMEKTTDVQKPSNLNEFLI